MTWEDQGLTTYKKKELILKQVSIYDVLEEHGLEPDGNRLRCPAEDHEDLNGSFYIYPETNSFYCFGCAAAGSVIDLEMLLSKSSFVEALDILMPLRKPENDLAKAKKNLKDIYNYNVSCDLRDFLFGLKKYNMYEEEKRRVDVIFRKLDEKLEDVEINDEQQLKAMEEKIKIYIRERKEYLMEKLDGYNEEKLK